MTLMKENGLLSIIHRRDHCVLTEDVHLSVENEVKQCIFSFPQLLLTSSSAFALEKILKNSANMRNKTWLNIVRIHTTSRGASIGNRSSVTNTLTNVVSDRGSTFAVSYPSG
jgi:hypothetical protein